MPPYTIWCIIYLDFVVMAIKLDIKLDLKFNDPDKTVLRSKQPQRILIIIHGFLLPNIVDPDNNAGHINKNGP